MVKKHIDDLKFRIERLEANPGRFIMYQNIRKQTLNVII